MDRAVARRDVLRAAVCWGGVSFLGPVATLVERLLAQGCDGPPLGELVGTVPLHGDRPRDTTFGVMLGGAGLDARLFTDLSTLQSDKVLTPTSEVFVRTAAPVAVRQTPATWSITTEGFLSPDASLSIDALRRGAQPMGAHLIECSGNADPNNFGLMSVAEWAGVPLAEIVPALGPRAGASGLLVAGLDDETEPSSSSNPGASWVLPLEALPSLGAFLAVGMNGAPLTPDHGAPVRLVIPGWYGCSWIKWVTALRSVGAGEPTTSQMREFSLRTHQGGVPALSRDYAAPVIDLAATPIRVEKRRLDGRLAYRIVGIVWGGDRPVDRLAIRFKAGATPEPFRVCQSSRQTWSLWEYYWRPTSPGIYHIALTAADASIRTRRLDVSYYVRRVVIDDV